MLMNLNEPNSAKVTMRVGKASDTAKAATPATDKFTPMTVKSMTTQPAVKSDKA